MSINSDQCKLCSSNKITVYMHTAKCKDCGVLLYYPYPADDSELQADAAKWSRNVVLDWYTRSSFLNHSNFTNMLRFAMNESFHGRPLQILDYGGGGGQFAYVVKSHFPQADIYIVDISDSALLDEWSNSNRQIKFDEFKADTTKFDFIFMNDVFEHVNNPVDVLLTLKEKLKSNGKIFIDAPKQFWLYPMAKLIAKPIYAKLLRGTVSRAHLQIWTKKSFSMILEKTGFEIEKYFELSEFTMPPAYYLNGMGIESRFLRLAGHLFYRNAKWIAKNKIMSVIKKKDN